MIDDKENPASTQVTSQNGSAEPQASAAERCLEDPDAYRAWVLSLRSRIESRLTSAMDPNLQLEIGYLTRMLVTMPRDAIDRNRVYFELAFDLVAVDNPNLLLIKSIRTDLTAAAEKSAGSVSRFLSRFCGSTPLNAAIAGFCTVVVLSIVLLLTLAIAHRFLPQAGEVLVHDFPLLFDMKNLPVGQILLLIHAAFIGSLVSIISRIRSFLSLAESSALLVYVTVITKPFLAAMTALLVYSVIKIGLISFLGVNLDGPHGPYVVWTLGFLCGFSERFAQDMAETASSKLGVPETLDFYASQRDSQNRDQT